jgi:hypothetical protein
VAINFDLVASWSTSRRTASWSTSRRAAFATAVVLEEHQEEAPQAAAGHEHEGAAVNTV